MSKEIAPAFQFYAAEYLADEKVQLMSLEEEGCYIRLMAYCWREGSIPSDPEMMTRLCKGITPSSAVQVRFDYPCEDTTRLMHPRLEIERQKIAEYRKNSAKGGKRSAHKRKHKKDIVEQQCTTDSLPSERQVKGNTSSSTSSSIASVQASQAPPVSDEQNPANPITKKERKKDETYELFAAEYLKQRGIPYGSTTADFVQLSKLRKLIGVTDIPKWDKAVDSYFKTPQGKYTLADLCNRFDAFIHGPLDRYGKPVEEKPNGSNQFDFVKGESGSTSDKRNERGERLYIPKQV